MTQSLISETTKNTLSRRLLETAKTPKPLTVEQLVLENKGLIRTLLKNGHTYDDLAVVLTTQNLDVAGTAIETIIHKTSKKKTAKDKAKQWPAEADLPVTQAQADAIIAAWGALADVRKGFTKQELVTAISDEIDQALAAGYSYDDIAAVMASNGLKIAASSLRKYHRASKQPEPDTSPSTVTGSESMPSPTATILSKPLSAADDVHKEFNLS